ncbi:MAG: hypothetical protein OXF41_07995 [bacterium]|nr:hypothetical protein [bacterium]
MSASTDALVGSDVGDVDPAGTVVDVDVVDVVVLRGAVVVVSGAVEAGV